MGNLARGDLQMPKYGVQRMRELLWTQTSLRPEATLEVASDRELAQQAGTKLELRR